MTLDETIKNEEEEAEFYEKCASWIYIKEGNPFYEDYVKSAKEHRQLVEWLRELRKLRAIFEKIGRVLGENGYTMDDLDTIFGKVNEEVKADADSD